MAIKRKTLLVENTPAKAAAKAAVKKAAIKSAARDVSKGVENTPIEVSDPKDPRLKRYNDSLLIYKTFHDKNVNQIKDIYERNKKDYANDPDEYRRLQGYGSSSGDIIKATTPAQDFMSRFNNLAKEEAKSKPKLNKDGSVMNPFKNKYWTRDIDKPKNSKVEEIATRIAPVGVMGEYPNIYKKPTKPYRLVKPAEKKPVIASKVIAKPKIKIKPKAVAPTESVQNGVLKSDTVQSKPRVKRPGERIVADNASGGGYPNIDNVYINNRLDSIQNQAGERLKYGTKFTREWQYRKKK